MLCYAHAVTWLQMFSKEMGRIHTHNINNSTPAFDIANYGRYNLLTQLTYQAWTSPSEEIKRCQASTVHSSTGRCIGNSVDATDLIQWLAQTLLTSVCYLTIITLRSSAAYLAIITSTSVAIHLYIKHIPSCTT